jgi:hypothetical protein
MKISDAKLKELSQRAKKVLEGNWVDLGKGQGFTQPAQGIYPFQWNWDSAFSAYGYAHYKVKRAITELRTLFSGQWSNGFLPHVIFHKSSKGIIELAYSPGPKVWEASKVSRLAPREIATSAITQPPVQALALWHIYKEIALKDKVKAQEILEEFYSKLYRFHCYLHTARDPEKWGLITIYHPWESGSDNSPRWDEALARITLEALPEYRRVDIKYVEKEQRPTQTDYDYYISLLLQLKNKGYDDERIYPAHPFKVKDKTFSAILYLADQRLLYMARVLKKDTTEIVQWMERFEKHLFKFCWDEKTGLFYDYDLMGQKQIKVKTAAAVMPMVTGLLSPKQAQQIVKLLDQEDFCGQNACPYQVLPSVGIHEKTFQPNLYWRGPVWLNMNWFMWRALRSYGFHQKALDLADNLLRLVDHHGFYEFYSPMTGKGLGAQNFSWSAAVIIEIIHDLTSQSQV